MSATWAPAMQRVGSAGAVVRGRAGRGGAALMLKSKRFLTPKVSIPQGPPPRG